MPIIEATYDIAKFGLATSFEESEQPPQYALKMRNRFINSAGGAEKRQGMVQLGDTVTGTPNLNGSHELVNKDGDATLLVSGEGSIFKYDGGAYTEVKNGLDANAKLRSVQSGRKLIFYNGVDRNIFTEDGTTFEQLHAIIERGEQAATAAATITDDINVTNWISDTDVVDNDIVFNHTGGGYGLISAVASGAVTHTTISSAAGTGLGNAPINATGDRYSIFDLIELNIIPTADIDDNTATSGPGTNATTIAVSGVNFSTTDVRVGDFISNTTRSAVVKVSAVATALTVTSVASQTSGDALVFFTEAMPVASNIHVHFGRTYYTDASDKGKIRISGPNNPQDMTTDSTDLDANTFSFGEQQPQGEVVQDLASFQRFLGIGGKQNLMLFSGTNPIADVSGDVTDLAIVGLFPQGIVSPDSLVSIGNDLVFVTPDGVQTASLVGDASTLGRANISEAIRTTIRDLLKDTPEDQIIAFHYPRRSWFVIKIGSELYVFNYSPFFGSDTSSTVPNAPGGGSTLGPQRGSWSLFDGKFARQNTYLVRQDGSLVCAGAGGKVYEFDTGFIDDDEPYNTDYQSSWLTLSEPRDNVKKKQGNYIKPIFDTGAAVSYDITAEGEFAVESGETITVDTSGGAVAVGLGTIPFKIGGSSIQNVKHALRWRGEQVRITFSTRDTVGPDTIARFTLYANQFGTR